jgi:ATP-binding cassette subfamily F protein 3
MLLVEGNKISFHYESQYEDVLKDVSFIINNHSKIGLIGKNGAGKSTLIKLITGQLSGHKGVLSTSTEINVGLLPQELPYCEKTCAGDILWKSKPTLYKVKKQIESTDFTRSLDALLFNEYEELGGYQFEVELEKVLDKLDLSDKVLSQPIGQLSGGERTKIGLAEVLLRNPDIIILDEPTNHLDLKSTIWLEEYLSQLKIPFIVVGHDRCFFDRCVSEIWEIDNGALRAFPGNYSFYKNKIKEEYEAKLSKYEIQQKKIKQLTLASNKRRVDASRMEGFKLERSVKKNGGLCSRDLGSGYSRISKKANPSQIMKRAKTMEKKIEMMIEKEKADKPFLEKKRSLTFTSKQRCGGRNVIEIRSLNKSFEKSLFSDLDLFVERGDKYALIGGNGCGKSTLLKIITGEDTPDKGVVKVSPSTTVAYYSQTRDDLNYEESIIEAVTNGSRERESCARNILGSLGLTKDKVFQIIGTLSSGERSKVSLAKAILSDANLLILDEPTGHLEIKSKEAIEEALEHFSGTILFVSHDRHLIKRVATKIFDLEHVQMIDCN